MFAPESEKGAETTMSKDDVHGVLCDLKNWQAASKEQREAFCNRMTTKQYGIGPLRNAWHWFADGWEAAKSHV